MAIKTSIPGVSSGKKFTTATPQAIKDQDTFVAEAHAAWKNRNSESKKRADEAIADAKEKYNAAKSKSESQGRYVHNTDFEDWIPKEYREYYKTGDESTLSPFLPEKYQDYFMYQNIGKQPTTKESVYYVTKSFDNTTNPSNTEIKTESPQNVSTEGDTSGETEVKDKDYSLSYEELMDFINDYIANNKSQATEAHDIYKSYGGQLMDGTTNAIDLIMGYGDKVMSELFENPLETDWGKGILNYYGVLGDQSANAVNADTAADNSGNIDSYAAANAERQRLSKLGQGISAINGMSTERFSNMVSVLDSIGVNTANLFGIQGQYGVGTAADYANSLYGTDASSTAAYNELMAQLEGNTTITNDLSDNAVISKLKEVYSNLNIKGGDSEEIDWSATDAETWDETIETLLTNPYYSGLTPDYLNALVAQIMKPTTNTDKASTEEAVNLDGMPNWLKALGLLATTANNAGA